MFVAREILDQLRTLLGFERQLQALEISEAEIWADLEYGRERVQIEAPEINVIPPQKILH